MHSFVFDIIFSEANGENPEADAAFEAAIERNGNVILGADYVTAGSSYSMKQAEMLLPPHEPFEFAAASTGFVQLHEDTDFMVRRHYHSGSLNLAWQVMDSLQINTNAQYNGSQTDIFFPPLHNFRYIAPYQILVLNYQMIFLQYFWN